MVTPVKVHILDKEFLVACPDDEKSELLQSASYLNRRMREIRDSGKVIGMDRIAVMAALNITHELLSAREQDPVLEETRSRLAQLTAKLDTALADVDRPEAEKSHRV
ncbi:cell division protein ZapA [Alkalilimnicola ehrlichii]|uniref:Cell division protein ZapA n=1 Tax=Alkalilimnicola ehrlichii TaxID=351052 RepID=A0A3E0X1E4_9GAMM|nr:cell division protein ZapA [Alkalilimnicola ehrlichii]RFA31254.1 cell division protein ZapA [Alkalilimnicola ehrlichii]RFA39469.1 cell division protein ZapA [Alkalilimnicola ehrlichii]